MLQTICMPRSVDYLYFQWKYTWSTDLAIYKDLLFSMKVRCNEKTMREVLINLPRVFSNWLGAYKSNRKWRRDKRKQAVTMMCLAFNYPFLMCQNRTRLCQEWLKLWMYVWEWHGNQNVCGREPPLLSFIVFLHQHGNLTVLFYGKRAWINLWVFIIYIDFQSHTRPWCDYIFCLYERDIFGMNFRLELHTC